MVRVDDTLTVSRRRVQRRDTTQKLKKGRLDPPRDIGSGKHRGGGNEYAEEIIERRNSRFVCPHAPEDVA